MAVRTVGRRKIEVTLLAASAVAISPTIGKWTPDFSVYFPSGNSGAVAYIGDSGVDNSWIPYPKEKVINYVSGTGSMGGTIPELAFDLGKIYIQGGADNDIAIVEYMYYDN